MPSEFWNCVMIDPRIWLTFFATPFRDLAPVAGLTLAAVAI
jgi:hypothetical protein